MSKINGLDSMSYAQLRELRNRVDAAMVAAQAAERRELRRKMEALAAKAGMSIADVLGATKSTRASKLNGAKVPVKFRNPKNHEQTWTGRGRQPLWLVDALKKGQKLETFRI
jgi:DNA-binding protein H-NS